MTRVDFGDGSILFLNDAEVPATDLLLNFYNGSAAALLDADVLQVSHHGSNNGTSPQLAAAVTPKVAIVPVGHWSDGRKPQRQFSTFANGHPNLITLQALDAVMDRERGEPLEVMAGTSAKHFNKAMVSKGSTPRTGTGRFGSRSARMEVSGLRGRTLIEIVPIAPMRCSERGSPGI